MTDLTEDFGVASEASSTFEQLKKQMERAARSQEVPTPGTLVGGRYRIQKELGQGGFGTVFEVLHEMLGRKFAMKVLNPRVAEDPDWVARFREEARATSLIGHEAIVYVTDFGEDPRWGSYFVMEYLDGRPLDEIIADEAPMSPERVSRLVHSAAGAFGAVHDLGIVHCDLKPSNVFAIRRGERETWRFLDFGTSTMVMNTVQTQALYGTPKYMAPEQSIGRDVDGRADLFSLGCVVYEMLTGNLPWSVRTWLQAMPEVRAKRPPPPPSEISSTAPPEWDEPILRALAIDPDDRFDGMGEFSRALDGRYQIDWEPANDPMDVRPESTAEERERPDLGRPPDVAFQRTMTAPSVSILQPASPPSVVIDVDSGEEEATATPIVDVSFRTRDRFIREYRRNLSVGGLFVPSDDLLELRSRVEVRIVFEPTGASTVVGATVVGHEPRRSAGRGFGVHIDASDRGALEDLVRDIQGPGLEPRDVLRRDQEPTEEDVLSPGEGFVLSRIDAGMTVARLRAMCAGLPFDVDDVIRGLVRRGWVSVVEGAAAPADSEPTFVPAEDDAPETVELFDEDVEEVLERVDFHRNRANYLGASEVLERAIQAAPDVAEFHYRLALLRLEFDGDSLAARGPARRAVKHDPDNETYAALLESLRDRE